MRSPSALLPLTVLALLAAGCGTGAHDAATTAGVRVDTIAGVVHVTSSERGLWDATGRPWRVHHDRALTIGEVDGPEGHVFGQAAGVFVDDDGRVYAGDARAAEVRVFSAEGELVGRIGRPGEGPGEFRHVGGVGRAPDGGIAVLDGQAGRISVFDSTGAFRRSFRLERPYMILFPGSPVRFDDAGRFHDLTPVTLGIDTDSLGVVRYSAAGEIEDTVVIAVRERRQGQVMFERNGVPVMSMPLPYAPQPSGAVGPDGSVYTSPGAEYRIARLDTGGNAIHVIHRTIPPVRIGTAQRDSARAALVERFRETVGAEPRDLPPIPEQAPAVVALHVDDLGHLWVLGGGREVEGRAEWDVFDRDGVFLGTLGLPAMAVRHIGERHVAGVVQDELGVQRVVVVPLERG